MSHELRNLLSLIADGLTALGTLLAVIVALHLARRDRLIRCIGNATVYVLMGENSSKHPEFVAITITNVGTRSFLLSSIFWRVGIFRRRLFWMKPVQNEYSSLIPTKLSDGEQASFYFPLDSFRSHYLPKYCGSNQNCFHLSGSDHCESSSTLRQEIRLSSK